MRFFDDYDDATGDRICRDCRAPFTVFATERRGYLNKGLEIPRRCKRCRERRRKARAAEAAGDTGAAVW